MTSPEPTVTPTRYLVSCLPEGHDDAYLFAIVVEYRGNGLWAVKNRSQLLGADRNWSWGFRWSGEPAEPATEAEMDSFNKEKDAWLAEHRFDLETALRLAKEHAPRLMYRGHGVAAALSCGQP